MKEIINKIKLQSNEMSDNLENSYTRDNKTSINTTNLHKADKINYFNSNESTYLYSALKVIINKLIIAYFLLL